MSNSLEGITPTLEYIDFSNYGSSYDDLYRSYSQISAARPMYVRNLPGFTQAKAWWDTLDWHNPNPYDARYIIALQWAYLERFGQGHILSYGINDKGVLINALEKMFFADDNLLDGKDHYYAHKKDDILRAYNSYPTAFNNVADNPAFPKYVYGEDFIAGYTSYNWPIYYSNDMIRYHRFKPRDYTGLQIYIKCLRKFFKEATLYAPDSPRNQSMISVPDLASPYMWGLFGTGFVSHSEQDRYISPAFYKTLSSNKYNDLKDLDVSDIIIKNFRKQKVDCYQKVYGDGVNLHFYSAPIGKVLCSKNNTTDRDFVATDSLYTCKVDIDNFNVSEGYYYSSSCYICCCQFTRKFYFTTPMVGEPIVYVEKPERNMGTTSDPYHSHNAHTKLPVEIAEDGMSCQLLWEQCNGFDKFFTNGELDIAKFLNLSKAEYLNFWYNSNEYLYSAYSGYYASMSGDTSITLVDLTKGAIPLSFI